MVRVLYAVISFFAFTASASAQLIVSSAFNSAVYQYSPSGGGLQQTYIQPNSAGIFASRTTVGPDNNLYISFQGDIQGGTPGTDSIYKYNLATHTATPLVTAATLATVSGGYYGPAGLRFGSDGYLYVARNGGVGAATGTGAVDRFSVPGVTPGFVGAVATFKDTAVSGLTQPTGITINGTDLYVSNLKGIGGSGAGTAGSIDKIGNYTSSTNVVPASHYITGSTTPGSLENPTGTTFGPDGKLYIADVGDANNGFYTKVVRYNANGTVDNSFATPGLGSPNSLSFQFSSDVIFRDDGKLLVANLGIPAGYSPSAPGGIPGSVLAFNADTGAYDSQVLLDSNISPSSLAFVPVTEPALLILLGGVVFARRLRRS